jgi:hypothetical protein
VESGQTLEDQVMRYPMIGGIAPLRSEMIDRWIGSSEHHAVLYATVSESRPSVSLNNEKPIEKHWQLVRALVKLNP